MGCEPSGNKKSGGHQRRETQTLTKNKKMTKKWEEKQNVTLVIAGLDLTAFLKGPEGCPLDHRCVPIRAFHTNFDLLSIHMGSSSNSLPIKLDKNGSYNGSYGTTMVVPVLGNHNNQRCSLASVDIFFTHSWSLSSWQRLKHSRRKAGTDSQGGNLHNGIVWATLFPTLQISSSPNLKILNSRFVVVHTFHTSAFPTSTRIPFVAVVTFAAAQEAKTDCFGRPTTSTQVFV